MPIRRRSFWNPAVIGLLAAVLAFVGALQFRSQAEVLRTLEGQDNTALAFLIDGLHRANEALSGEIGTLAIRRDTLRSGNGPAATAELEDDAQRLRIVEGLIPVAGPGVRIQVDATLERLDLQDTVNNLRLAGAEAIDINGRRVVTGTVIRVTSGSLTVDGAPVKAPFALTAIGDPVRLDSTADLMVRSLRSDRRVRAASYSSQTDIQIVSVAAQRPFVYGSA